MPVKWCFCWNYMLFTSQAAVLFTVMSSIQPMAFTRQSTLSQYYFVTCCYCFMLVTVSSQELPPDLSVFWGWVEPWNPISAKQEMVKPVEIDELPMYIFIVIFLNSFEEWDAKLGSDLIHTLIARFMGPTWGPSGADRTQVGPILAPWTLLSGYIRLCWLAAITVLYWTGWLISVDLLSIVPMGMGTHYSEILIKMSIFSLNKNASENVITKMAPIFSRL